MKKISVIIVSIVMVFYLLPYQVSFAEETSEFKSTSYFFAGVGAFEPTEEAMKIIYGELYRLSAGVLFKKSENLWLEGSIGYIKGDGDPLEFSYNIDYMQSSSKITMLQLKGLAKYAFSGEKTRFHIGGGLINISAKETIQMDVWMGENSESASGEATLNGFGVVLEVGVDFPLGQQQTTILYIEYSACSALDKGDFGQEIDLGGAFLEFGLRFKI